MLDKADNKETKIFGDFQTPEQLAVSATNCLKKHYDIKPQSIIEPTCGKGAFLIAAANTFSGAKDILGIEINPAYFEELNQKILPQSFSKETRTFNANFFDVDWQEIVSSMPEPILITGNPPWVTNSGLGALSADNLPKKNNFQARNGIEAITGKANFDISEWMILQYLDWLSGKQGTIAILCKTSVARKVLFQAWKKKIPLGNASIFRIDALKHFNASVDACFFVARANSSAKSECFIYDNLGEDSPSGHIGYKDNIILSNLNTYAVYSFLNETDPNYTWRSGVKHDCSKVMELNWDNDSLSNGMGEEVSLENDFVYPLLKSSDLGNGRVKACRKKVIVTQKNIGEDTTPIKLKAPKTWKYLQTHADALAARKSSIYRNRPPFSVFGIGEYSFSPWKVAISGLYKRLKFFPVGQIGDQPVMFDDTVYFLPCNTQDEAEFITEMLNSSEAQAYLDSLIFWQDKRPITIDVLKRLSLRKLAALLDREDEYLGFLDTRYQKSRKITPQLALELA